MTKEQLGDEMQKIVDRSELSVELAMKVFEGGITYGKIFVSGDRQLPQLVDVTTCADKGPRFIIYPPGIPLDQQDAVRASCDALMTETRLP